MALKINGLVRFRAGLLDAIDAGVDETADEVHDKARANVHVITGALRTSIEKFGAGGTGERTVEAGQSLDYAVHEEYGTQHRPGHPYMTPAAEQADLEGAVAKHIKALEGKSKA